MTYIGQSISHNDAIPPSVVISELLEVLQSNTSPSPAGEGWGEENQKCNPQIKLITKHPLQPFSRRYFDGTAGLFSFSKADCETAQALSDRDQQAGAPEQMWWQGTIPQHEAENEVIELSDLFSFFNHPQRYFFQRQLDLRYSRIEADPEEREPFSIDKLQAYSIYQEWIRDSLNDQPITVKKLQAEGRWMAGVPGELEFDRQQQVIKAFVEQIKAKNPGAPLDDLPIDITIDQYRVVGKLGNRYQNGSLIYRYANLKGKDFISALLHHLLINQIEPQSTLLLSADEDLVLLPDYSSPELLVALLEIYRVGQKQPNAIFVEAALAYIKQTHKLNSSSRASKSALDAALEQLDKAAQQTYEPELKRLYGNLEDMRPVLDEAFELQCQNLLQPIWDATH
jgi:exodeoxyribonuclease V gamma subunit